MSLVRRALRALVKMLVVVTAGSITLLALDMVVNAEESVVQRSLVAVCRAVLTATIDGAPYAPSIGSL